MDWSGRKELGYEVDFLPVQSGGAAISVRWGSPGAYKVLVYDGGTAVSGEQLVAHVESIYMTSRVDYVVSSNPAEDHVAGLSVVLRKLDVGELWMHRPWLYDDRLRHSLIAAHELEQLASLRRIPVSEPFAGQRIGPFVVLSPEREWYLDGLLPAFGAQPAARGDWLQASFRRVRRWTLRFSGEGLDPDPRTTAENESSAVLYGEFDGCGVMLTGNSGVQALEAAANAAENRKIDLRSRLCLIQAPNAGSLEHVSAKVLDRLIGESGPTASIASTASTAPNSFTKSAYISVSIKAKRRLSRILTEALNRRGVVSYATLGVNLHHWYKMPDRGWHRAKPILGGG